MSASKDNLSREEFARLYGIHVSTVDRLRKKGVVKSFKLGRKIFIFPPDKQHLASLRTLL